MAREQMQRARILIEQRRYAEARKLLRRIDHPKAREWLAKLDTLSPHAPKRMFTTPILVAAILVVLAASGTGILLIVQQRNSIEAELLALRATGSAVPTDTPLPSATLDVNLLMTDIAGGTVEFVIEGTTVWLTEEACSDADWWAAASPYLTSLLNMATEMTQTPRAELEARLGVLHDSYLDFYAISPPPCNDEAERDLGLGIFQLQPGFEAFASGGDPDLWFTLANQSFFNAYHALRNLGLSPDIRLADTSSVWGGEPPSAVEATRAATAREATQTAEAQTLNETISRPK